MKYRNVIRFHAPFERIKQYNNFSEVSLYKSVILQAIIDATNLSGDKSSKTIALEAKTWLLGNSDDFQFICDKANMEPSFIRKIASMIIDLHVKNMQKNKSQTSNKSDISKNETQKNQESDKIKIFAY